MIILECDYFEKYDSIEKHGPSRIEYIITGHPSIIHKTINTPVGLIDELMVKVGKRKRRLTNVGIVEFNVTPESCRIYLLQVYKSKDERK